LKSKIQKSELKQVSIIIPAYNEQEGVGNQISGIQNVMDKTSWTYQIIVVNDGSTDNTLDEIKKHDVHIIDLPLNRGYGAAIKAGISEAEFEVILITDADGTYPSSSIPDLLSKIFVYDMVVAARIGAQVEIPWKRKPAKWFLRKLAGYLSESEIPDLNSGLRVMKKQIINRFVNILPSGFSFTTTITLALLCNGYSVYYQPIEYRKRTGKSKIRPVDAYHFLILILRTIIYFNPLKIFLPLGAAFFLLGLFKFIYDLFIGTLSETAILGFLGAFIFWAIGLLSDQISRIGLGQSS